MNITQPRVENQLVQHIKQEKETQDESDEIKAVDTFLASDSGKTEFAQTVGFLSLSRSQRLVLDLVAEQVQDNQHFIKRVLVQGQSGTGKSLLIREICRLLDEKYPENQCYQVLASFSTSADNVGGETLDGCLKIDSRQVDLEEIKQRLKDKKFIIFDDYSNIGLRKMGKISQRLCEANGNFGEPFGGFFVYFFGDLRQLKPLFDISIYQTPTKDHQIAGLVAVKSIQRVMLLDVVHRQEDQRFREILGEIAVCKISAQTNELLKLRCNQDLSSKYVNFCYNVANQDKFEDAVTLVPMNKQVDSRNEKATKESGKPIIVIESIDSNIRYDVKSSTNLLQTLEIAYGSRVMLNKSIGSKRGLRKGSIGFVKDILFEKSSPHLPAVILVEFTNYEGPHLPNYERLYPVKRVTESWMNGDITCSRCQFPLKLASVMTIHMSQGLNLDKVIIDLSKLWDPAMLYVALSRVRRFEDLMIANYSSYVEIQRQNQRSDAEQRERLLEVMEENVGQSMDVILQLYYSRLIITGPPLKKRRISPNVSCRVISGISLRESIES